MDDEDDALDFLIISPLKIKRHLCFMKGIFPQFLASFMDNLTVFRLSCC